jgi:ribosomal protein S27AE
MSKSIQCLRCGTLICPRTIENIIYLYKDNKLTISNDRCPTCGERFFYVEKSRTLYEIIFPYLDYGFCKHLKNLDNIYTSYMPIPSLVEDYKNKILSLKKKNDIVIGFDGWEDIVIDKSLAGGWYMTYNSPPVLDVAVINCSNRCFGVPNIFMSYFPSPLLNGKVKIIDDRDVYFFEKSRNVMLDEKRVFYIGIKE